MKGVTGGQSWASWSNFVRPNANLVDIFRSNAHLVGHLGQFGRVFSTKSSGCMGFLDEAHIFDEFFRRSLPGHSAAPPVRGGTLSNLAEFFQPAANLVDFFVSFLDESVDSPKKLRCVHSSC